MDDMINVLKEYQGNGALLLLYLAALLYLLITERNRRTRLMLVYLPLTILILFLLPPVYRFYTARNEGDTYYRILWLLPMGVTMLYAGLRAAIHLPGKIRFAGYAVLCAAVIVCGSSVYRNSNVIKAENRLHVPHQVVDICDYLLADSGGEEVSAAFPSNIVQFVRQYTSRVNMPYGRDMLIARWGYWNEVYDAMEKPDTVEAKTLVKALNDTYTQYLVILQDRSVDGDFADYGMEYMGNVDGFDLWKNGNICP